MSKWWKNHKLIFQTIFIPRTGCQQKACDHITEKWIHICKRILKCFQLNKHLIKCANEIHENNLQCPININKSNWPHQKWIWFFFFAFFQCDARGLNSTRLVIIIVQSCDINHFNTKQIVFFFSFQNFYSIFQMLNLPCNHLSNL